jgi:cytochrome c
LAIAGKQCGDTGDLTRVPRKDQAYFLQQGDVGMIKSFAFLTCVSMAGFAWAQVTVVMPREQTSDRTLAMGKAIAAEKCQSCHAIATTGASANPRAPPLRTLGVKYPIDTLSEAFAEGIFVGHAGMPEFELEQNQIDALVTYLESIQVGAPPARAKAKSGT